MSYPRENPIILFTKVKSVEIISKQLVICDDLGSVQFATYTEDVPRKHFFIYSLNRQIYRLHVHVQMQCSDNN